MLRTNKQDVIDLSLNLPGMAIISVSLLRRGSIAFPFAPALLFFCVVMDINIAVMILAMRSKGIGEGTSVAVMMLILALISSILLWFFVSCMEKTTIRENSKYSTEQI